MNSMPDAFIIGLREGLKFGTVWLVFISCFEFYNKKSLIRPFYAGLFMLLIILIASFFLPLNFETKEYVNNINTTLFALVFILSAGALFHASGIRLFSAFQPFIKEGNIGLNIIVFLTTVLLFSPDVAGTVLYLREISLMKNNILSVYPEAAAGFVIPVIFILVLFYAVRPVWIGKFFEVPQLILFLAIVKLLGSGVKGITELSLIPSVQKGFMKFIHDLVHQTFVLLMVPDHPLLKTTVWNFIAYFFEQNFASWASLFLLLVFPFLFIYHSLSGPVAGPDAASPAMRRKIKSGLLSDRRKKSLPVVFFICLILFSWFFQRGESTVKLYRPETRPVYADKGTVTIPLADPSINIRDGRLHKFGLRYQGEEIRIIAVSKADNTVLVCLDACEICPPEGYAQRQNDLICIYCNTPIPLETVGLSGGCNPIPLSASVNEKTVTIELKEILKKWEAVKKKQDGVRREKK